VRDDQNLTRRTILAMTGSVGLGALVFNASGQEEKKKDQRKDQGKSQDNDQPKDQEKDQEKEQRKEPGKQQAKGPGRGRRPGRLWRVTQSGSYQVTAGDVLEVTVLSNPSLANNPANTVRVEIEGEGVARQFGLVYVPPAPPRLGGPGEARAYLLANQEGETTVTVTPISSMGHPGEPLRLKVQVAPRRAGQPE
jgi:hypothetical protein